MDSPDAEASPLTHALDGFSTALDHLVKIVDDGGLDELDSHGLVQFAQTFETIRNRTPVVDHILIRTGTQRELPHSLCQRDMVRVLTGLFRSHRRTRVGEFARQSTSPTGRR